MGLIGVFLSSQSYQCSPFFLRKQQSVYLAAFDISAYCVMHFFFQPQDVCVSSVDSSFSQM